MSLRSMDPSAPLCLENPSLHAQSPVSLALQRLEESRARLLHPITPSASWLASLKPLDTRSQVVPDQLTTPYAPIFRPCKDPEPAQRAPVSVAEAKNPLSYPAFSEPNPQWLKNPFLKQPVSAPRELQGLEVSRAHLLRPVAASQLAFPKALDGQFESQLDRQETFCAQTCMGLSVCYGKNDDSFGPSSEPETPLLNVCLLSIQGQEDEHEMDLNGLRPAYFLTVPDDPLKVQLDERHAPRDELPVDSEEQDVKEQKLMLLSLACCSLVEGAKFGKKPSDLQQRLVQVCESLAEHEPEFILKVALYTRQELNIRSTANFLLALSSRLLPCRPHLRRYFCHAMQLPSDWMEVARLHQSLAGEGDALAPMPSCLRAAMADKFRQFDAYQLAKYNTRKSRGKKRHRPKNKQPGSSHQNDWKQSFLGQDVYLAPKLEFLEKMFQGNLASKEPCPAAPKDLFSLKALIERLHISEPAQHVMSLLGRRYPSDLRTFSRSRLPGLWDPRLSGTRMKLPNPVTWDRALSERGNKAAVWEDLIDSRKLPFMAMLRNLRNILQAGVSERHHKCLLQRLEEKESVIHSRQLPFRFLAACKVILQLEKDLNEQDPPLPSASQIIKKTFRKLSSRVPGRPKRRWEDEELQKCMEIPVIFRLVQKERKRLRKCREMRCSRSLLQRYRQALETAIGFAVRHNVPPIPGRTLILITQDDMMGPYMQARDLYCPNENLEGFEKPVTKLDVAMLLGSMVYSASEQAQLFLCSNSHSMGPIDMTGSVLKDVQTLQIESSKWRSDFVGSASDIIMDYLARRQHVDTILLLSGNPDVKIRGSSLRLYRHHVSPNCLFVNVCGNASISRTFDSTNDVVLFGFSEQVLRFMAECGGSRFLEHVGKVDEIYGLPKQRGTAVAKRETGVVPLIPAPKNRWRSVRVFVSSTFRDMHGERDLLIRSVFPELRARAAQFCLAIEDIDLRWGITEFESQSNKQIELCLSEVSKSQLFIGVLGKRYGSIPKEYSLPDEPQFEWVKSYPAGRSITEMEIFQFLEGGNDPTTRSRAFFYLREPEFESFVPDMWKADFLPESEEAKDRLADLKERLCDYEGLASLERYACRWGGVAHGRPYVAGLEYFGTRILEDVWECLRRQFIEVTAENSKGDGAMLTDDSEEQEEKVLQESFQELQQKRFCARKKLLDTTAAQLYGGRLYVVSGEPGQGKTVFLAALAQALRTKAPPRGDGPAHVYHIVAHFTRARPNQAEAQVVLGHLCALLRKLLEKPPPPPRSYRGLVGQFEFLLHAVAQALKPRQSLVVLIDGADFIHAANEQLVSDWLPEQLPQRVSLVLSVSEDSALLGSLKRRKDAVAIPLGPLDPPDRVAIVRKDLALYGKKLEETAFNNQMRLVLLKRGSQQPLYLTLLTQDLRLFAQYEKLSERIQKLPVSLPLLLQHLLGCLEQDHGLELVSVALAALWASREGLTERDLYSILATWKELSGADITLEKAVVAGRRAGSYPMAPFLDFLRSLRGLLMVCGSPSEPPGSRLHLCGAPLKAAVERRYLKKPGLDRTAHVLLAAHWWKQSDPDISRTFRNCEAESLRELPYHLVRSGHFSIMASFLYDLRVVSAHLRLGLLHCLFEAHALYETADTGLEHDETVEHFRAFLQKNVDLLSQNPQLLLQLGSQETDSFGVGLQAHFALLGSGIHYVKQINKPVKAQKINSLVLTLPAVPSCVSVSPSGKLAVVGTAEGTLHLLDVETGQELKSLLSACDGVSACEFISETSVCLGAFNGRLELWSLREGCRLLGADAHKAQITDCCINSDRKQLATVSLDGCLKLWESTGGHLIRERDCLCPLNSVTFHPNGQLVATGGWDRTVTVLDANEMSVSSVLRGHDSSIHSISFSSAGNVLAAGSLAGSVHLWSWREAVVLSTFLAHSGCVSSALFLPGGKLLTAGEDCKVQLWTGHLGKLRSTLGIKARPPAVCAAPSLDGSRLAVGHHPDDVWIYSHPWNNSSRKHCQASGVALCSLAWLDSVFLLGGRSDGSLCVWNTSHDSPSCVHELHGHEGAVTGLSVSKKLAASTSEDFMVRLWFSETLRAGSASDASVLPLAVLRGHTAGVTCCAFSLDGCYLATGGKDRALFLWDVKDPSQKTPSLLRSLPFCHKDWVSSCAWAGPIVLSGSNDGTVSSWDPKTGQRLQEFLGHQSPICGVTAEKEYVISVGRDGMLVMWDLQGMERSRFLAHPDRANHCVGFRDPQEKGFMLVACGCDGTVKLWKPLAMGQSKVLPGHCGAIRGAAASPGSFLTISDDQTVRVWAVPEEEGDAQDLPPHDGAVTALAWSPDGKMVASGGERGDLIVWHQARAKVGPRCISALAFTSPDTILVVSDGISLWDIKRSKCRDRTDSLRYRNLLRHAEEASVVCVGTPRPGGPLVLGLANGGLLSMQPGAESFQEYQQTDGVWDGKANVSFDISASEEEEGVFHIWDSMQRPNLFKMKVTKSGRLKDISETAENIPWTPDRPSAWVTVARLIKGKFLLCADSEGFLWTQTRQNEEGVDKWKADGWQKRKIHSDKITALHVLGDKTVTASHDRDVKIWDSDTMKLLGQFRCHAPVSCLQPHPKADSSLNFAVGDASGNVYFLAWDCLS
ncbi:telomerase protein component 1 isoform X2 [Elgaria multicarinata webbii]|uniref:telomerase protein component 1 isoform X2 n=1 Tax=Elgaria multicarinata webbii TaxID=159646 RepID=UPI002FCD4E6B